MQTKPEITARKRPYNLSLSEPTVAQARQYTSNLSAVVDELLNEYVRHQQQIEREQAQQGEAVSEVWNRFNEEHGSFADEHSTL